jgi:hypothetical protein
MKKVIEPLESIRQDMSAGYSAKSRAVSYGYLYDALKKIDHLIAELKATPRWETPEQWEQRTGEKWPDDWAVYFMGWFSDGKSIFINGVWQVKSLREARDTAKTLRLSKYNRYFIEIICATEAGPPPDGWRPEEETK